MRVRRQLAALAVVFLFAHLLSLPATLEDIDSVNFALGVRDFDVAQHQPHPPGYPVFVALAKLSTASLDALGVAPAAPKGLALLSAVSGAVLIPVLFAFFGRITDDRRVAWWAMAVAVSSPLFWFTALRPLSDMTGLAFAAGAQVFLLSVLLAGAESEPSTSDQLPTATTNVRTASRPALQLLAGASLCAVAAGVRTQTLLLTGPLLLAALLWPGTRLRSRDRALALLVVMAGALVWAVPLVAATGGLSGYFAALGTQAGEDFSGVVMLWTRPEPRVALHSLLYSFVWPWGWLELGFGVLVLTAIGCLRAGWRAPRVLLVLAIAFGPYAVFHMLFHETATVRYALPLIAPAAFCAIYAIAGLGRIGLPLTGAILVMTTLALTIPAARAYGRDGSPAFRLFDQTLHAGASESSSESAAAVVGMHAVMRRVEQWRRDAHHARVLRAHHGREWLALVEHWRTEPSSTVRFFADPRRTDLALFDPHARHLTASERWTLPELPFVAGTRPGAADLYTMSPPGWMLDRGWALTAEIGGVAASMGLGPHVQPSVAWVRARPDEAVLIVGGRNLGAHDGPAARLILTVQTAPIDTWEVRPGGFFRRVVLPQGTLAGGGYVPVRVSAAATDGSGRPPIVALEQFDVQSEGTVMFGYLDGWHEPEYNPTTARSWRWMSETARFWVRPIGRDVTLTLTGESPLRYFDRAPAVRVLTSGVELARFTPSDDFTHTITVPAKALTASGGLVVLESDLWFSPADRSGVADRRHLALRIYSLAVH